MKVHRFIAHVFGYELINRKKSHERYFLHLLKLVKKYQINTILDVGANVGQYARELRKYGYKGLIISFEPLESCFQQLSKISKNDPLWKIHNFALGSENSTEKIFVPAGSDFASFRSVNGYAHTQFSKQVAGMREETVHVRCFESWLTENSDVLQENIFLKLDTQGFDLPILKAAEKFLPRILGLSTELAFKPLYEKMPTYMDVMAYLTDHKYAASSIFPISRDQDTYELIEADGVFLNTQKMTAFPASQLFNH